MGVRIASSGAVNLSLPFLAGNTTTLVVATGQFGLVQDNAQVIVLYNLLVLIGTGITTFVAQVRRGNTTAGVQVNTNQTISCTAGTQQQFSGVYIDTPGVVGAAQYNISAVPGGSVNNSQVLDACIMAFVL